MVTLPKALLTSCPALLSPLSFTALVTRSVTVHLLRVYWLNTGSQTQVPVGARLKQFRKEQRTVGDGVGVRQRNVGPKLWGQLLLSASC